MAMIKESEKFETWLHGDDLLLAQAHMSASRIRQKAEFTRQAILGGGPRHDFEQDCQIGVLALAVNRLTTILAGTDRDDELARMTRTIKALTKNIQKERALLSRQSEWR